MKRVNTLFSLNRLISVNHFFLLLLIPAIGIQNCSQPEKEQDHNYAAMADTLEASLFDDILDIWYPRVIDSVNGGYFSTYGHDWEKLPNQEKSIVYTARHMWTTAIIAESYPDRKEFLEYSMHGFPFLRDHLWDSEMGGYFIQVSREGDTLESVGTEKRIYGQAFAIYGLAQLYLVSGNEEILDLAKKSFQWIEDHAHDKQYGGYFEFLERNGDPMPELTSGENERGPRATQGYKDFNSSIHILEALTTLYHAWPDELVRERLQEMFHIVRDTMVTEPGYLKLHFRADWTHVSVEKSENLVKDRGLWFIDHITFGHDIETAYLIIEAAEALDMVDEETMHIAKMLVDHTLKKGWDSKNGGIYDAGVYLTPDSLVIVNDHKAWWGEIEALNSLLIMHAHYPDDEMNYYDYFLKQWNYINTFLIDHENGEWFNHGLDTHPESKNNRKAHNWKTPYHNGRGINHCVKILRDLAEGNGHVHK